MDKQAEPRDIERTFNQNEIIVTKTDLTGRITYANEIFLRVSEMDEREVVGHPHSVVRHPDMPRGVFKLLWETIAGGNEIFAYVKNMSSSGAYYWVLAHVTPTLNADGQIAGYHSNRRVPDKAALNTIMPLYKQIQAAESSVSVKAAPDAGLAHLKSVLDGRRQSYDQFVFSLINQA